MSTHNIRKKHLLWVQVLIRMAILMSTHNICKIVCCGYSLNLPQRGDSNDYP